MRCNVVESKQKYQPTKKEENLKKQGLFVLNALKGTYKGNSAVFDFSPFKIDKRQARSLADFKSINNPKNLKRAKSTQQVITIDAKRDHRQKIGRAQNQKYLDTVPVVFYSQKPYMDLFMSEASYHRSMQNDEFQKKRSQFLEKIQLAKNNNQKSQLFEPKASDNFCFICKQEISQLYTQFQHTKTKQHKRNLDKSIGQKYIIELVSDPQKLSKILQANHDHKLAGYKLKGTINPIKIEDQEQKDEVEMTNVRRRKKVTLNAYNQNIVCLSDSVEEIDEPSVQEQPRKFIKTLHIQQINPKAVQNSFEQRGSNVKNNILNANMGPRQFYGKKIFNLPLNNPYRNQTNLERYNFAHQGINREIQATFQRQTFQPPPETQRTIKIIQRPQNLYRAQSNNKNTVNFLKQEIKRKAKSQPKYANSPEFGH